MSCVSVWRRWCSEVGYLGWPGPITVREASTRDPWTVPSQSVALARTLWIVRPVLLVHTCNRRHLSSHTHTHEFPLPHPLALSRPLYSYLLAPQYQDLPGPFTRSSYLLLDSGAARTASSRTRARLPSPRRRAADGRGRHSRTNRSWRPTVLLGTTDIYEYYEYYP